MGDYELDRYESFGQQTVIIVHGTQFDKEAATANGKTAWWQPDSDFSARLDTALAKRKTNARCWAHLGEGEPGFEWDGENDWQCRSETADRLREHVKDLQSAGWTVHLVGHSHGGNVILEAVANANKEIGEWFSGRICLLGTPVFNNTAIFHGSQNRLMVLGVGVAFALLLFCTWFFSLWEARPIREFMRHDLVGLLAIALVLGPVFHLVRFAHRRLYPDIQFRALRDGSSVPIGKSRTPQLLLIGSEADEAYKLLKSLSPHREAAKAEAAAEESDAHGNKNKKRKGTASAILRSAHRSAADAILSTLRGTDYGVFAALALSLLAALFWGQQWDQTSPVLGETVIGSSEALVWFALWLAITVLAFFFWRRFFRAISLPLLLVLYGIDFARKAGLGLLFTVSRSWIIRTTKGFVRQLAYGFLGGPIAINQVDIGLQPNATENNWLYLELPESTVGSVRERQNPKLKGLVDDIYDMPASNDAFDALMNLAGKNEIPLVHNVYHQDADCLDLVAGWINAGEAISLPRSRTNDTTKSLSGGFSEFGDFVAYPYYRFWEAALLDLFKPEDGWQCILPRDITVKLRLQKYSDASVPRFARLYQLYQAMNGEKSPQPTPALGSIKSSKWLRMAAPLKRH